MQNLRNRIKTLNMSSLYKRMENCFVKIEYTNSIIMSFQMKFGDIKNHVKNYVQIELKTRKVSKNL